MASLFSQICDLNYTVVCGHWTVVSVTYQLSIVTKV